jgi:serine/threonine protein kinase
MGRRTRVAPPRDDDVVTPERWQQIKGIVAQAMEMPPADRAAYVERECADDVELSSEVNTLLVAAEGVDSLPATRAAIASTAEQSALGSALGEQYEIVRRIGRGGMGAVYLARERALERFVAIKVLRPDLADHPDALERFRREARIAAQLSHPGILPLHTFGEVAGLWYFVMAYVRGVSSSPTRSSARTAMASFIATSSRRTFSSTKNPAARCSRTLVSPRCTARATA